MSLTQQLYHNLMIAKTIDGVTHAGFNWIFLQINAQHKNNA